MFIKIAMLVIFIAVTITVGFRFRSRASDVAGFVLGGHTVGPWLTAFAYGTSYFSAVVFVGYAGQFGWRFGLASTWIGLGNAFIGSLLPWVILGKRTRLMTHHLGSKTMPDFFGQRYSSKALKIGASIIAFVFLVPYTASLYNGLSRLFVMAFGIDFIFCIIAMAILTGVYVILGGYVATAVNDLIQGIVMLGGIIAVIGAVLKGNGGFINALKAMSEVTNPAAVAGLEAAPGIYNSFLGPDPASLLGVVLLTSLGTWGLPQLVGKFYAIKSEKDIFQGTIISSAFALIVAGGCYFIGGFGRLYANAIGVTEAGLPVGGYDAIIPSMMSQFSDVLVGMVMVLVLSASISTLSSLVMTSASTFTIDFMKDNFIKDMDDKLQLIMIRSLVAVFIVISSTIAVIQYRGGVDFIAQLMGISWGALAGAFLAPFLYGLFWKRVNKASVWACFIFSISLMVGNIFFRSSFPAIIQSPINCGALAMIAGLIIVPAVSLVSAAPNKKHVDNCFACYEVNTATARAGNANSRNASNRSSSNKKKKK